MQMTREWRLIAAAFVVGMSLVTTSCGHSASTAGTRDVSLKSAQVRAAPGTAPITQAELQESLQRFTGVFIDRMSQAMTELGQTESREVSDAALRRNVLYISSSLDIATGPLPEINLLDMAVFLRLCREAFETHFIPQLYGDRGKPVVEAFRASEEELWRIGERVITSDQHRQLEELVDEWQRENPGQFQVEGVRLMDFSMRAGKVDRERAEEAGGLLSSVRLATQTADQALLIAQRGMFLAQRMPFLVRMQARIGSREIVSDTIAQVGSPAQWMAHIQGFEPMLQKLPALVEQSGQAAHEARLLARDIEPLIPTAKGAEQIEGTLTKANELTQSTRQMLQELRPLIPTDTKTTVAMAKRGVDDTLRRGFVYLVLLGAAWSVLWWGGYYLVKRRLARRTVA